MREERAGAEWAAPAWPPLLRNPYNRLRAGGWSFTASNTCHVGGQQERQRRFSVLSGEDSGRKEMEGVPSKRREPCVVSSNFSFRCVWRDDLEVTLNCLSVSHQKNVPRAILSDTTFLRLLTTLVLRKRLLVPQSDYTATDVATKTYAPLLLQEVCFRKGKDC
ncbi:unnamed protein product [Sphagnum compactum]